MKLLYPDFLWALLAILVPVLIHLFNFKKFKKEYFSNISLLKEVKLETQSKSKLKHLLILFTRILAIVLLVLAFCQPYFETSQVKIPTENVIGIYLDNSQSMDAKSSDGYLFDLAKIAALEVVSVYSPSDDFQLLTNDFEGKHQRIVNQEEMLKLIEEVQLSPVSKSFKEIYEREKDLLKSYKNEKQLFWFSDFQKNNLNISSIQIDSLYKLKMIPFVQEELKNLYIDSVWFSSPLRQVNQDEQLNVRIVNKSNNDLGVKVNLRINKEIKGILNASITANSEKTVQLNYSIQKRGEQLGEVYLSDYPDPDLIFDDSFLFSYTIAEKTKILYLTNKEALNEHNNVLMVYANNENHKIESESFSNIDYSTLSDYSLLIVDNLKEISTGLQNEIQNYLKKGGTFLLIPSENINKKSYNELFNRSINAQLSNRKDLQSKVGGLREDNLFFDNVFNKMPKSIDLPLVSSYYPVVFRTRTQTEVLLSIDNNDPFLSLTKVGKGTFYFLASPLTQSTFKEHAIFVPVLLKIAENSQVLYPLYYEIGAKGLVTVNDNINNKAVLIKEVDSDFEFIPEVIKGRNEIGLAVHDKIEKANHYQLFVADTNKMSISYNYSRSESDLNYYSFLELTNEVKKHQLTNSIQVIETPKEGSRQSLKALVDDQKYWKYFVIGTLIFLLLEIVLIRLFKS